VRKLYEYSHLGGREILRENFAILDAEVDKVISAVVPQRSKRSLERQKKGRMLYDPKALNKEFRKQFNSLGWTELKDRYAISINDRGYKADIKGVFKQVDFKKEEVLCEVQLGKYFAMFYDLAKFQYFFNSNQAAVGIEIVPTHAFKKEMSSGVSYGEQLVFDLERIGRNFPSVPVKVVLVDA